MVVVFKCDFLRVVLALLPSLKATLRQVVMNRSTRPPLLINQFN